VIVAADRTADRRVRTPGTARWCDRGGTVPVELLEGGELQ
jgi:hypothetical protein